MSIKIKDLLELNKTSKRRLMKEDVENELYTSKRMPVKPKFISVDIKTIVTLNDPKRLADPKKCFTISPPIIGKEFISKEEAQVILGYDFFTAQNNEEIQAMLEAIGGGLGSFRANAYFLGGSYNKAKDISTIPVVYFKIPDKFQQELIINQNEKKFSGLIEKLSRRIS